MARQRKGTNLMEGIKLIGKMLCFLLLAIALAPLAAVLIDVRIELGFRVLDLLQECKNWERNNRKQ